MRTQKISISIYCQGWEVLNRAPEEKGNFAIKTVALYCLKVISNHWLIQPQNNTVAQDSCNSPYNSHFIVGKLRCNCWMFSLKQQPLKKQDLDRILILSGVNMQWRPHTRHHLFHVINSSKYNLKVRIFRDTGKTKAIQQRHSLATQH